VVPALYTGRLEVFLYIDPLKQGLKQYIPNILWNGISVFLYIDPLKQGLKLVSQILHIKRYRVFIHRSIKTRIETF